MFIPKKTNWHQDVGLVPDFLVPPCLDLLSHCWYQTCPSKHRVRDEANINVSPIGLGGRGPGWWGWVCEWGWVRLARLGVCWVTIQGWAGGWAGLGLGSGLGWVLFSILIHHSQLPNKPYLSRPRGGGRPGLKIFKTLKIFKILKLNNFNILNPVHFPILKIFKILKLFDFNILNIFNIFNILNPGAGGPGEGPTQDLKY